MTTNPSPVANTVELKSCPLCGDKDDYNPSVSTSYKYAHPGTASTDLVESGHFIECDKCGCCGPIRPIEEEAITAWNTRSHPPTEQSCERKGRLSECLEMNLTMGRDPTQGFTLDDLRFLVRADTLQSQERTIAELRSALERISTMADCEHSQRFARKALGGSNV